MLFPVRECTSLRTDVEVKVDGGTGGCCGDDIKETRLARLED